MKDKHTYTETHFHACLLVHGWKHDVVNPGNYWATIDLWFKDAWPERYVKDQPMNDHSGQMEFKLQFFSWVRNLKPNPSLLRTIVVSRGSKLPANMKDAIDQARCAAELTLTQLCNYGAMSHSISRWRGGKR